MAYVAVTGGKEAIEQSLKLTCMKENMALLVDKIMSEAGFYSEEYAALALKQCEGSVEEAVFLLRAYRSTLPRNYYSLPIDTGKMRILRRISAAFARGISARISMAYPSNSKVNRLFFRSNGALICFVPQCGHLTRGRLQWTKDG